MRIPGDIGTVVEDDGSSKPFRVKASSGSTWWYTAAAIEKAGDGSGSAAAASGAYEDTDAWWGAVAQGYDPTKLRTMRAACRNDCLDLFNKEIGDGYWARPWRLCRARCRTPALFCLTTT